MAQNAAGLRRGDRVELTAVPGHADENTGREVEVLQAAYGSLGYTISRLPNGSLRAFHAASKYTSDADSAGGLRKSIIERETGTGIHGSPGGVSGK